MRDFTHITTEEELDLAIAQAEEELEALVTRLETLNGEYFDLMRYRAVVKEHGMAAANEAHREAVSRLQ